MIQKLKTIDFKSSVVDRKACSITIDVEVSEDIVSDEIKLAFSRIQQRVKIHGFRQGKVPMNTVSQKFSLEAKNMAVEDIIKITIFRALEKEFFDLVGSPVVEKFDYKLGQIFRYRFTAECHPKISVVDYKNIFIKKEVFKITDDNLLVNLDALREKSAKIIPSKSCKVTAKSLVVIDYDAFDVDGNILAEITAKGYMLDMDSEDTLKGFKEAFVGANIGDKKDIKIDYPTNYQNETLKGKTVIFKTKIVEVKEKELPNLDDDFAKKMGVENLENLKAKIRKMIEIKEKHRQDEEINKQIVNHLLEKNNFEVPKFAVEQQKEFLIEKLIKYMRDENCEEKSIEEQTKFARFKSVEFQKESEKMAKLSYVLKAIYFSENLKVTDADIVMEKNRVKASNPGKETKIDNFFTKMEKDVVRLLENKKTFDFLIRNAKIEIEEKNMSFKKDQ
ncbi:MAG: trigger factor [Endomicrobium sp.]|jgi:trigger factor|nr:trigger factor [Endomicrobium sp.]